VRLTPEIIAAMHELAVEQRRELGVRAPWHVGDITWGLRAHEGREDEWTIRIWKDGDRTVAWSWLKGDRGLLEFDIRRDRLDLLDEMFSAPDVRISVAFADDPEVHAALLRNGFTPDGDAALTRHSSLLHFLARDLPEAPELPELPEGFRCRTVEPGDLAERVAIHQEVWAPSRVTESSFATIQASWPYRASLDCVVEAPDGRFADAAASVPPCARSRYAVGTRRADGRRSSTARTTRRAGCTSRSAFAATPRSSATRAADPS
jgi:hypothetical protein